MKILNYKKINILLEQSLAEMTLVAQKVESVSAAGEEKYSK